MIESRFDKLTLAEIRKELCKRRCLSDVAVGETVLRLSFDKPCDLSREVVSKLSRSSVYLESMNGTRFDKANGIYFPTIKELNSRVHEKSMSMSQI